MPGLLILVLAAVFLPGVAVAVEPQADGNELQLGSVSMDIPAVMHQRLRPLADYLGRELGRPVHLRVARDFTRAIEETAAGQVDIAYLAPAAYVQAREAGKVRVLAKTVTRGSSSFRLVLVTRDNSPITSPAHLPGRRFAFGDEAALLQRAVLLHAGISMEQLGSYKFVGHFDNIARGVINGDFDAGILKDTTAYQWEKKGLRIIHASPELPPYNIAVGSRVNDALAEQIRAALLRLNVTSPEHDWIIKALDASYDGFASAADSDYDVIRNLIKPFRGQVVITPARPAQPAIPASLPPDSGRTVK